MDLTPRNYALAISSLANRFSSGSTFPGDNYIDIKQWMLQDRSLLRSERSDDDPVLLASDSEYPHDLVIVYNPNDRQWDIQHYSQQQNKEFSAEIQTSENSSGQIVFIRGFVSPSWISAIGSKYKIDPEFFRRHMDYLCCCIDRHAYSLPSLPSSSNNVFRLCITTILQRDDFTRCQELNLQRSEQAAQLSKYKMQQLGSMKVHCGDSVVREYSTLCSRFSVIEQWISICIARTGKDWTVLAWLDHGRPLEQSPPGPWTDHVETLHATSLPVIQHHPKMAFRTTTNRLNSDVSASADVLQSAAVLPLQYDSLLALVDLKRRASLEPLAMCTPLFSHAAFSEVQFLNIMECKIQSEVNAIAQGLHRDALGTLQYFDNILNRHAMQLKDCSRALGKLSERNNQESYEIISKRVMTGGLSAPEIRRQAPEGATVKPNSISNRDDSFSPRGLLEDFQELRLRCTELSKLCSWGITLAMNKASIEESRKGIEQSDRVKKLTILATLFIPINFTSSLFGMNLDVFGQGNVQFWWFFIMCVPTILVAYSIYLWDIQALTQACKTFVKRSKDIVSAKRLKDKEKAVGSIV